MNPYHITEPACISFSGGRSSGYMLKQILDAHGGTLPDYIKVVFANTGKEMPQTLDFVRDCAEQWGVDITWLELGKIETVGVYEKGRHKGKAIKKYETKIVSYATASRNGEPFRDLVINRRMPPNVMARFCTEELKVRRIHDFVGKDALQVIGIRGDEPRRAIRLHGRIEDGRESYCPMWLAKVTKEDVGEFWVEQSFDLQLPNNNGVTDFGNCDLCYLKGKRKRVSIASQRPDLVKWWSDLEEEVSAVIGKPASFRHGEHYAELLNPGQADMFGDDTMPCFCGD